MKKELTAFQKRHSATPSATLQAFYLSALVGAVNRASDANVRAIDRQSQNIGKWLGAIALACSTPDDNSEEVKRQMALLEEDTAKLETAVKANQPEGE